MYRLALAYPRPMGNEPVEWSSFDDEHESFGWIADALAALTGNDAKLRREAIRRLDDALVHQGGVFLPASAEVMPHLLAYLADPKAPDVERVLRLATELALAGHANHLPGGWGRSPLSQMAGEPPVRSRYVSGLAPVVELLKAKKASVRAAALLGVAFVPERAKDLRPRVHEALTDKSAPARFAALLAAGLLAREDAKSIERLIDALDAEDLALRLAAACGLCAADPGAIERDAVQEILLESLVAKKLDHKKWVWNGGRLRDLARRTLRWALREGGSRETLRQLAERADDASSKTVDLALFEHCFAGLEPDLPLPWRAFDEDQRWVLLRIANWKAGRPVLPGELRRHGVVDFRDDLRRLAGIDAPGPVDALLDDEPIWRHLMRARDDQTTWPALATRLEAALTPDERIAMASDAIAGPYRLSTRWPPVKAGDRIVPLAGLLAETLRGVPAADVQSWARNVAEGPRHAAVPAVLRDWAPAALALLACQRVDGLDALDPSALRTLVWTAVVADFTPIVRSVLEAWTPGRRREVLLEDDPPRAPWGYFDLLTPWDQVEWALGAGARWFGDDASDDARATGVALLTAAGPEALARLREAHAASPRQVLEAAIAQLGG